MLHWPTGKVKHFGVLGSLRPRLVRVLIRSVLEQSWGTQLFIGPTWLEDLSLFQIARRVLEVG